ncbi:hypothetical protein [Pseudomonas aeruginosa]|uniref:hypothetical protein n=1 Tax=Pseudomonas aeruginosa TaxID=287 RepID=UPI000F7F235C|nr:hypothetical protein [Pseudomonas aeruginosa]RTB44120.1 hypothetical protein EJ655_08255 [Pseudomonas aeruginosa]
MTMPFPSGSGRRPPIPYILVISWLIGLTVASAMSLVIARDLAEQAQVDVLHKDVLAMEARVTSLSEAVDSLRAEPQAASSSALRTTRQQLEQRLAQLEQVQAGLASTMHLELLRDEIEQIKAAKSAPAPLAAPLPAPKPKRVEHKAPQQLPFRVLGIERRADERFLAVAPVVEPLLPSQIKVLRLGEHFGAWQLERIEADTATFRDGQQMRRVAIPAQ